MKQKIRKIWIAAFLTTIFFAIVPGCSQGTNSSVDTFAENYSLACDLFEAKNYAVAADTFKQLIGYADAEDKYKESTYLAAYSEMDDKNYENALTFFSEIEDYKDASTLGEYCKLMAIYSEAERNLNGENYFDAYSYIQQLPTCSEKAALLNDLILCDSIDLKQMESDFDDNEVRAENQYKDKFFIISGTVKGTGSKVFTGAYYVEVQVGNYSYYANCYGLSSSVINSVTKGDWITLAGKFDANYGWLGTDFVSCALISDDDLYSSNSLTNILGISTNSDVGPLFEGTPEVISAFEGTWLDDSYLQQVYIDTAPDSLDINFAVCYGDPSEGGEWWTGWNLSVDPKNIIEENAGYSVQGQATGFDSDPFNVKITIEEVSGRTGIPNYYTMQIETNSEEFPGGHFEHCFG